MAVRVAVAAFLGLVVLAVTCLAQSNEKPDVEFHAPFRTSVADTPQEFREKYFLADWMVCVRNSRNGACNLPYSLSAILLETRQAAGSAAPAITISWHLVSFWTRIG